MPSQASYSRDEEAEDQRSQQPVIESL